jgi:hypothetical protein
MDPESPKPVLEYRGVVKQRVRHTAGWFVLTVIGWFLVLFLGLVTLSEAFGLVRNMIQESTARAAGAVVVNQYDYETRISSLTFSVTFFLIGLWILYMRKPTLIQEPQSNEDQPGNGTTDS